MKWLIFSFLALVLVSGCTQYEGGVVVESPKNLYIQGDDASFTLKNNLPVPINIPGCEWLYIEKNYEDGWKVFYVSMCVNPKPSQTMNPGEEKVFVYPIDRSNSKWIGEFRAVSPIGFFCEEGYSFKDAECANKTKVYFEFEVEKIKCKSNDDCVVGGCANSLCGLKGVSDIMPANCNLPDYYGCIEKTSCVCIEGECVWEETPEFRSCKSTLEGGCGCGK
jgi:eight-cysteine-cluster-containing protein